MEEEAVVVEEEEEVEEIDHLQEEKSLHQLEMV